MLKGNLTCEDISKMLLAYIEEKLNKKQKDNVALHLRNCPFCMEKYRIIKKILDSTKEKKIQRARKFQQYKLLSAYCDNEVSLQTKENIEASLSLSCNLVHKVVKINSLRKILGETFENKFGNLELGLEKKIIERVKKDNIFYRIKALFKS